MNDEYIEKKFGNVEIYYKTVCNFSIPSMAHIEIYIVHFTYLLTQFIW